MTPLPLIINFGVFCFCLTGPVANWLTIMVGMGLGWNAGLYYAALKIDEADRQS